MNAIRNVVIMASLGALCGCAAAPGQTEPATRELDPAVALSQAEADRRLSASTRPTISAEAPIACIAPDDVAPERTPADIFAGVAECVNDDRYDTAAELYMVGAARGFYDRKRVADRSAHKALFELRTATLSNLGERERSLNTALDALLGSDTRRQQLCDLLATQGAPSHSTAYMENVGIGEFIGEPTGRVTDLDEDQAWRQVRNDLLECQRFVR